MIELRDEWLDPTPAPAVVHVVLVCAGAQVYRQKHAAAEALTVGDLAMTQALLFGLLGRTHPDELRPGGADADADADGEVGTCATWPTWENARESVAQARAVGVGAGGRGLLVQDRRGGAPRPTATQRS